MFAISVYWKVFNCSRNEDVMCKHLAYIRAALDGAHAPALCQFIDSIASSSCNNANNCSYLYHVAVFGQLRKDDNFIFRAWSFSSDICSQMAPQARRIHKRAHTHIHTRTRLNSSCCYYGLVVAAEMHLKVRTDFRLGILLTNCTRSNSTRKSQNARLAQTHKRLQNVAIASNAI